MTTSVDLTPYLDGIGLKIHKVIGDEIVAWCPAHLERLGRYDNKPSFSFNQDKLAGHCFSCDWKVPSLEVLVEYLTGEPPTDDVVIEARKQSLGDAVRKLAEKSKGFELSDSAEYMEWTLAQKFTSVPRKILAFRKLTMLAADHYQIRWNQERHCQIMPIRTPRGMLMGWQERQRGVRPNNYPAQIPKASTLFGLHQIEEVDRVALVESPLDVVRLWQAGIPAVASFGAGVSNRQIDLLARNFTAVVVALDNDDTGNEASGRVLYQLRKRTGAVRWDFTGTRAKDPGDYEDDQGLLGAWRRTFRFGL